MVSIGLVLFVNSGWFLSIAYNLLWCYGLRHSFRANKQIHWHEPLSQLHLGVQNAGYIQTLRIEKKGMMILWSKSTNPSSTLRECLSSQHSQTSDVVRLHIFGNPFRIVSINLYCGLLHPTAQIMPGEVSSMLLLTPNVADRVVDLTQLSMSWDSMMSDWEGSAGNIYRNASKMAGGLQEMASEILSHFTGKCWMVNLYQRFFFF